MFDFNCFHAEESIAVATSPLPKKKPSPLHIPLGVTSSVPASHTVNFAELLMQPQSAKVPKYVHFTIWYVLYNVVNCWKEILFECYTLLALECGVFMLCASIWL